MTDLEKFVDLYKSIGIKCEAITSPAWHWGSIEKITRIICISNDGKSEKIGGYSGFFTSIIFDENGKFICQRFWE